MDTRSQEITAFIRTNLLQYPDSPLDLDTSLADNGSLDSMGSTLLAAFIEQRYGVRLREEDLTADRIGTIRKVLALIDARATAT